MKFFDSHCHLQFDAFNDLRDQIISDIVESNSKVINVGSSIENSRSGTLLSKKYPNNLYSSIGIHPVHSLGFSVYEDKEEAEKDMIKYPQDLNLLREMIDENVKAIGECGIDFSYLKDSIGDVENLKQKQIDCFKFQIELAKEFSLPLILHVCKEYMMALEILNELNFKNKAVFHFFKGKYFDFEEILRNSNYYFSFSNVILYDNSMDKVVYDVPIDRLMIETDGPYVPPISKKGEINEPKNVFYVAEKISKIKGMKIEEILDISYNNGLKFFNI